MFALFVEKFLARWPGNHKSIPENGAASGAVPGTGLEFDMVSGLM